MANMMSRRTEPWLPERVEDWGRSVVGRPRRRPAPPLAFARRGPSPALLIAGAAAVGLAYLTWTYLGPDLKRYMKIQNM